MNVRNKEKLIKEFKFMGRHENRRIKQPYQLHCIYDIYDTFPWDAGDGWFEILRCMCSEIQAAYKREDKPVDLIIERIREKYGTMRVYYYFEGQKSMVEEGNVPITIRARPGEGNELQREIGDIIRHWEARSATVCEACGRPGKPRDNRWKQTLCDGCQRRVK